MPRTSVILKTEKESGNRNPRICCEYKYVFVHIPKTAGNSIGDCLLSLPRGENSQECKCHIYKHAKAAEIKRLVGDTVWNSLFSFSFVRNPWDLMVSSYHWWLHSGHRFRQSEKFAGKIRKLGKFRNFINSEFGRTMINECKGEMFDWISEHGQVIVDFVGRFENINEDWKIICDNIGVRHRELPFLNQSKRQHYQMYYDKETREIIAQRFYKSIEYFGYKF